jgi:hypothetical protein
MTVLSCTYAKRGYRGPQYVVYATRRKVQPLLRHASACSWLSDSAMFIRVNIRCGSS